MGQIEVRGGAASVEARLEDLTRAAHALRGVAGELSWLVLRATRDDIVPAELRYALISPVTWKLVESAEIDLEVAALAVAARLSVLADSVSVAAGAYRAADALVERTLDAAVRLAGNVMGLAMRGAIPLAAAAATAALAPVAVGAGILWGGAAFADWASAAWARAHGGSATTYVRGLEQRAALLQAAAIGSGQVLGGVVLGWLAAYAGSHPGAVRRLVESFLPGFVNGLAGLPPGLESVGGANNPLPHDSGSMTGLVLAAGRRAGLFGPAGVAVERVGEARGAGLPPGAPVPSGTGGTGEPARAPRTARELFNRGRATNPEGLENGKVRVEEYIGRDGRRRFIVYVPGTTKWAPRTGREGTDLTTNVETVAGDDSVMREAVRRALKDSGAAHGDQVAMFGFSQGGIVAQSLASDPRFQAAYDVRGVMTVGAPTSDFAPARAKVLAIEHDDDLVPNLDGSKNPRLPDWTTITVQHRGADAGNPAASHNRDAYERSIAGLEDAGQPDLLRWERAMRDFLDADKVATRDYQATRTG